MQMRQLAASLCRPNLKVSSKSEQLEPVDGGWGRGVRLLSEELNWSTKDKSSTHLSLKLNLADGNLQADYATVVIHMAACRSARLQGMLGNTWQIQTWARRPISGWDETIPVCPQLSGSQHKHLPFP